MRDTPRLILASTSRYRRDLLQRLRVSFDVVSPEVDEAPTPGEAPKALAERLAMAKAFAVATRNPDAIVIGSDQVAELDGMSMGKPHTHERALEQLQAMSGRRVVFHTAVAVVRRDRDYARGLLAPVVVTFRTLDDAEIERYLRAEQPYDCAGSAKSEALGIALLAAIESDDPTALVGLPLIRTCTLLREAGFDPLAHAGPPQAGDAPLGGSERSELGGFMIRAGPPQAGDAPLGGRRRRRLGGRTGGSAP